jgi:FAD binding domain
MQGFNYSSYTKFEDMSDFSAFKDAFLGDLVTKTDPDYPKAIDRWAINAVQRAEVVAFVKSTSDVALAISYAKAHKLPIAVRGGGHSPYGASSSEGGLVIDLSKYLDGARVDPGQRVVHVGGGAVWETVDKAAIKHGLATVGGTVNHVCFKIVVVSEILLILLVCRQELEGVLSFRDREECFDANMLVDSHSVVDSVG